MNRIRGKLSYANVVSTLCLVLLLGGGTAIAATKLAKNSVGAKQLKKGAVTPAKLSKASRATLTGPAGSQGPAGAPGVKGDRGEVGPRGPGAIFIDEGVPPGRTEVATIDGIRILGSCDSGSSPITLKPESGSELDYFGFSSADGTISAAKGRNVAQVEVGGGGHSNNQLHYAVRNKAVDTAWQQFDLYLSTEGCHLTGTVTPSE
jgi:hypothetical protein